MKTLTFTASIAFLLLAQTVKAETKVKVDVYYETLCPDSIGFLIRQLIPSYDTMKEMMQLNLIPFGKAEVSENSLCSRRMLIDSALFRFMNSEKQ